MADWALQRRAFDTGAVTGLTGQVLSLSYTKKADFAPGRLAVEIAGADSGVTGDVLILKNGTETVFSGRIYTIGRALTKGVKTLLYYACDSLIALQSSDRLAYTGGSFSSVLTQVLAAASLTASCETLSASTIAAGDLAVKSYGAMLQSAAQQHQRQTGEKLFLRQNGGALLCGRLRPGNTATGTIAETALLQAEFTAKAEGDTRTRLRLLYDPPGSDSFDSYTVTSASCVARWGVLQETQVLGSPLNNTVRQQMGNEQLARLERETATGTLTFCGDWSFFVGETVLLNCPSLELNKTAAVTALTQTIREGRHETRAELLFA